MKHLNSIHTLLLFSGETIYHNCLQFTIFYQNHEVCMDDHWGLCRISQQLSSARSGRRGKLFTQSSFMMEWIKCIGMHRSHLARTCSKYLIPLFLLIVSAIKDTYSERQQSRDLFPNPFICDLVSVLTQRRDHYIWSSAWPEILHFIISIALFLLTKT